MSGPSQCRSAAHSQRAAAAKAQSRPAHAPIGAAYENNLHARQVDAHVAGQVQDQAELGNILVGVEPRLSACTHGFYKAHPLVESKRLWVHVQHLGNAINGKKSLIVFYQNGSRKFDAPYLLKHYAGLG